MTAGQVASGVSVVGIDGVPGRENSRRGNRRRFSVRFPDAVYRTLTVLWNTRYLDAILAKVHATDVVVKPEDVERLSPLQFDHVNVLGRYEFALKESIRQGQLRPLREPSDRDDLAA